MSVAEPQTHDQTRSELRKTQILDAAADCFREHGFHGASIAQISKAAGMSAGHIYHYFVNKEAIIAAIVERDHARLMDMTAMLRGAEDMLGAMLDAATQGVRDNLDPDAAALKLEIIAEAARNPGIAGIVRQSDQQFSASLTEILTLLRQDAPNQRCAKTLACCTELIATMYEGLAIRSVRNPGIDPVGLASLFRRVIVEVILNSAGQSCQTGCLTDVSVRQGLLEPPSDQ